MTLIGRLFVRGAAAAGTIGAAAMLALAPQPGLAGNAGVGGHPSGSAIRAAEPAPSAACVAARQAFVAALKSDLSEDVSERALVKSGADTADPSEDQTEKAGLQPLRSAMVTACEAQEPTEQPAPAPAPTAQCTAAKTDLRNALTQFRADEQAEASTSGERTAADWTEDQAAFAQLKPLFQAVVTACGLQSSGGDGH